MYVKSGMQKHPSFGWKYGNACQVCMVKFVAQLHFPGMPEVLVLLVSELCAWDFGKIFHNWLLRVPKMVSRNCCYTLSPLFCVWPFVSSFTALLLNSLSNWLQAITDTSKYITCKSLRKEKQWYSLRIRVSRFSAVFFFFAMPESLFFDVGDYN